jgi:ribosome biogenesis GTPase
MNLAARVVAFYGQQLQLELADGRIVTSNTLRVGRRDAMKPVCNDRVELSGDGSDTNPWVVHTILKRRNVLARLNTRGHSEVICANLDQLAIVIAAKPRPDWSMMDRYIAAARFNQLDALIIHNKSDLPFTESDQQAFDELQQLHIPIVSISREDPNGWPALLPHLTPRISVLVGQSGVGKSTLTNRLVPDAAQATQELSHYSEEGKHTTTLSVRLNIPQGGELIDSPGVRDYAPPLVAERDWQWGFEEIAHVSGKCQFNDCLHQEEPKCAVKQAVEQGLISSRRYHSYLHLLHISKRYAPGFKK